MKLILLVPALYSWIWYIFFLKILRSRDSPVFPFKVVKLLSFIPSYGMRSLRCATLFNVMYHYLIINVYANNIFVAN